jgi:acetyl esterase
MIATTTVLVFGRPFRFCWLLVTAFLVQAFFAHQIYAQNKSWPPQIEGESHVYKHASKTDLRLWVLHASKTHPSDQPGPAIVFFFGGGWRSGSPTQFLPQAKHLQSRGMTAILVDYRVASRQGVKPGECVEDAKSAVRWVRTHAKQLQIDPDRICAAGGSAGGHLAACTALLPGFDATDEEDAVSSAPNALALFNPVLVLAPVEGLKIEREQDLRFDALKKNLGVDPESLSPIHHVRADLPPTIIFHGEADTTVPISTVRVFAERMSAVRNRCELTTFPDAPHGFFNFREAATSEVATSMRGNRKARGQSRNREWYEATLGQLDQFLVSLQWLKPISSTTNAESAEQ